MTRLYRFALAYALPALLGFCILWKGGKSLEAVWLLTGTAWLLTLSYVRVRGRGLGAPLALWATLGLFVLWTIASYLQSSVGNYGLDEALRDGSYFLLFFWLMREARAEGSGIASRLLGIIAWGAGIATAVGIAVYTLQPVNRFVGTFFDWRFQTDYWPNAWGDFALLTWPLLLWMAVMDRKTGRARAPKAMVLRLAGVGIVLGCFFLSYSRGSFLAFIGQIILMAALAKLFIILPLLAQAKGSRMLKMLRLFFARKSLKGTVGMGMAGAILTLLVALGTFQAVNLARGGFFPVQSVVEKATFTADEGSSSIDERAQFWHQAWALSHEKPLFGFGPYAFRFVQPRLQEGVFATSDHPHNIVLKAALERGWPAAALHILAMLFIAWTGLAYLWKARGRLLKQSDAILGVSLPVWSHALFMIALLTALGGTLAHSMIDYNLQFVANGLLFWIEAALVVAIGGALTKAKNRRQASVEVLLASVLMIAAILEGRYLVISSIGRHAEAGGETAKALAWYELSKPEWFSRDMHLSRAHLLLSEGMPDEALRALNDSFAVNKEDARTWLLKAEAEEVKGNAQEAMKAYQKALELGKYNYIDALRGYIATARRLGDKEALKTIEARYGTLLEEYAAAIMANTHFIALTPNVESFAEVMDQMSVLMPAKAAKYQEMKRKAVSHAKEERGRLSARTPGLLW
jgi:O-antigen ligase